MKITAMLLEQCNFSPRNYYHEIKEARHFLENLEL